MRVFLTGGTGLVGRLLLKKLRARGDQAVVLSRRPETARQICGDLCTVVEGDPTRAGPWMDQVRECDAVVNLAGEGIFAHRWTRDFKDRIYKSRIQTTDNLVQALGNARSPGASGEGSGRRCRVLINGSAIGYYGPHEAEDLTEESSPGHDFLAKLVIDWEKAAEVAAIHGIRVVLIRTGVVLDANDGALANLLTPFKMGVGGPIGTGKQYMSWIHNEDECGLILFALDDAKLSGPINATAPKPVTNRQFATALGKALGRPSFMPTPAFALRVMLGEVACLVTQGQKVLPKKALAAGYSFQFPELEGALRDLLKR